MDNSFLGPRQHQEFQQTAAPMRPESSKRKIFLIAGGIFLLLILLIVVLTSGGSKPGQETMQASLQSTSEALGIIDEYEDKLTYEPAKNDVALIQILLRGNFQKLNDLYTTTYKPKKKFSNSPKVDTKSKEALDRSDRNNTLDSDILVALKPKIATAKKNLTLSRSSFNKRDSVEKIQVSIEDMNSIEKILNRDR